MRAKPTYVALTFSYSGMWYVVYHGWPGLTKNLVRGLARKELIPDSDQERHLRIFSISQARAWYPEALRAYYQEHPEAQPEKN